MFTQSPFLKGINIAPDLLIDQNEVTLIEKVGQGSYGMVRTMKE